MYDVKTHKVIDKQVRIQRRSQGSVGQRNTHRENKHTIPILRTQFTNWEKKNRYHSCSVYVDSSHLI